jgi:hypothetical protein
MANNATPPQHPALRCISNLVTRIKQQELVPYLPHESLTHMLVPGHGLLAGKEGDGTDLPQIEQEADGDEDDNDALFVPEGAEHLTYGEEADDIFDDSYIEDHLTPGATMPTATAKWLNGLARYIVSNGHCPNIDCR